MHKRRFLVLSASLVLSSLGLDSSLALAEETNDFPLRDRFYKLKTIETTDLAKNIDQYTIVDARSPFEYSIMHIVGAKNFPFSTFDKNYAASVKQGVANNGNKRAVFYCNGHHCRVAYEAAEAAIHAGLDALVYDSGIMDWAKSNPQQTLLLDKPLDLKLLISDAQFKAHSLSPKDFMSKAQAQSSAFITDVRDISQTGGVSLFPGRELRTGLDIAKLKKQISDAKTANQPMYFYDATGLQVKPLQYLLEDQGVKEYHFLQGGIEAYFDMLKGK